MRCPYAATVIRDGGLVRLAVRDDQRANRFAIPEPLASVSTSAAGSGGGTRTPNAINTAGESDNETLPPSERVGMRPVLVRPAGPVADFVGGIRRPAEPCSNGCNRMRRDSVR